jgi:hypothetical protein
VSQKKKKCAYRYTFSRPDKKDVDTRRSLQTVVAGPQPVPEPAPSAETF